jgi:hypothetical protein
LTDVTPTSELFERGASRGYVLLSELQDLYDPLTHPDNWVEDTAQSARDLGMQVLDDLVEDADRPEATPLSASSDSVRQYLNEIGRTDLLTPEQEVDLAKRYQAGLAAAAAMPIAAHVLMAVVLRGVVWGLVVGILRQGLVFHQVRGFASMRMIWACRGVCEGLLGVVECAAVGVGSAALYVAVVCPFADGDGCDSDEP